MAPRHVVVDGSNIATEGRSLPSLAQLDEAVREFLQENPGVTLTVVVDATFGHRIDESERKAFDEAEAANEVVSPPAGAIGRGDAFLLRIADKVNGTVLSNDSFQEFHGEYGWLFDEDRLIGGKPVPGVGWIFTPRTPVRGPKSREAVKQAKRRKAKDDGADEHGLEAAAKAKEAKPKAKKQADRAVATAIDEAVEPDSNKVRRRRRRRTTSSGAPAEPVNEPTVFFEFITAHTPGSTVEGVVDSFSSHGAFVAVNGARCYIPLSGMGDPPPRAAKEVLTKGETATFVVQALDPPRRGIELALPEYAHVAGRPTEETVEAEIAEKPDKPERPKRTRVSKKAAPVPEPAPAPTPVKKAASRKKAAAPAPAKKAAPPVKKAPASRKKAAPAPPPEPVVVPVDPEAAKKAARSAAAKKAAATRAAKKAAAGTPNP